MQKVGFAVVFLFVGCGQVDGGKSILSARSSAVTSAYASPPPGHGPLVVGELSTGSIFVASSPTNETGIGAFGVGDGVAAGDLDGDGIPEIVRGHATGDVEIFTQTGVTESPASLGLGTLPGFFQGGAVTGTMVAVGDINGDGIGDIVVAQPGARQDNGSQTPGGISVALGLDGNSNAVDSALEGIEFFQGDAMVVCDFNHDGVDDIIVGPGLVMYSGKTKTVSQLLLPDGQAPSFATGFSKMACGDLNGDGFADVIIASTSGYQVVSDPSAAPITTFPNAATPEFGQNDEIAVGDLDGDGFAEVAIGHVSGGSTGPMVILSPFGKTAPFGNTEFEFAVGDKLAIPHRFGTGSTSSVSIPRVLNFILYEAPSDKGSVNYSIGTTLGSSTTVTITTNEGVGVNVSVPGGSANGSNSTSVTFTQSSGKTNGFSTQVTSGTTLPVVGGKDAPDHTLDQFFILFDVPGLETTFSDGTPPSINIDLGMGTLRSLTVGQLQEIAQGQPSTIVDPVLLAILHRDIPTPEDAQHLLSFDPFVTGEDITQNPVRYAPLLPKGQTSNTVPLASISGMNPDGGPVGAVTHSYSSATTLTTATVSGTGFSINDQMSIPVVSGLNFTANFSYGISVSTTDTTANTVSDSITIGSDHICPQGPVQLFQDMLFGGSILTVSNITNPCSAVIALASFESLSDWQVQDGGSATLSSNAVNGNQSFSITAAPGGWTPIVSSPVSSTVLRALAKSSNLSQVSFALNIPTTQPNRFWIGGAQMFISAPSANVYNAPMGEVELTGLPQGQFDRLEFTVPSYALSAITGNNSDVSFTIVLNVNAGTTGWLVDDLEVGE